ncbi:tRNA adenosine deaminase-associated protein [Tsukamurella spumae]|uniref:tRNA adenosine deaminase-associated protein n=1 Tax=Tsukamurella spumae TaxID=44753 RepID=A0A846X7P9_9ACTN|nr:tRNA adenosine deaminase-associated protein [Tsukamurella spumae]NKY20496.1 tRNA adenosine deaminase-associated protein [Tsukamurella spumae]
MAAQTSPERYDDTDGYAVAVTREETAWTVHLLDPGSLGSIAKAEEEIKALRVTGAVFGLLNVDDEYFVVVRPGPSGTRLLLSDATAAVFDELAEQALERLNVEVPDIDPEEIEDTDPWPEGDLAILGDLGLGEQELSVLLADPDLYPDEQLQVIAERLGFDSQLGAILDSLG